MSRALSITLLAVLIAVAVAVAMVAVMALRGCDAGAPPLVLSTELERTTVAAVLGTPLDLERNLIYCASFQLAWNRLQDDVVGGPVLLDGNPPLADKLNQQLVTKDSVPKGSYVALAGPATPAFRQQVQNSVNEMFDEAAPEVDFPLSSEAFLAFAYLARDLAFAVPFQKDTVQWEDVEAVRGFGIQWDNRDPEMQRRADQVEVLNYRDGGGSREFVIRLKTDSTEDELILAMVPPQPTLMATVELVQQRIAEGQDAGPIRPAEPFEAPNVQFHVEHHFDELEDRGLLNPSQQEYALTRALQDTSFQMNEKGVKLRSRSKAEIDTSPPVTRHLVLNQPFLLWLRKEGVEWPYFALWVANPEIMVPE